MFECACCESERTQVSEVVAATRLPEDAPQASDLPVEEEQIAASSPDMGEETKVTEAPKANAVSPLKPVPSFAKVFEVSVTNLAGDLMGIEFFADAGGVDYLLVSEVKLGPVDDWNKKQADKYTQLRSYDRILAVNGETGTADALQTKLRQPGTVTVAVERPRLLQFKIERPSATAEQPPILPLRFWSSGPGLTIEEIEASSIVGKYIKKADQIKRVRIGDQLVMLNGQHLKPTNQAEADAAISELNLSTSLILTFVFRSYAV